MLKIECNICKHSFDSPISNPGEVKYQKSNNMFTINYMLKLPCPKCKTILGLQKTGENSALGIAVEEEKDSSQEKTQLVSFEALNNSEEVLEKAPKTKKVKIKAQLDDEKKLTDPKTAQVPEPISDKTQVKPFKILPQLLQKNKDFKLELKDNRSSKNYSNHFLAFAIVLCILTLSLFVFSLFKEKPLKIEDQSISQAKPRLKAKSQNPKPLLDQTAVSLASTKSDKSKAERFGQNNGPLVDKTIDPNENNRIADVSIGSIKVQNEPITNINPAIKNQDSGLNSSVGKDELIQAGQQKLAEKSTESHNHEHAPIDIKPNLNLPENYQGGLDNIEELKDETLSYETFDVDTTRYQKNLLHLPELGLMTSSYGVRLDPFTHQLAFHGGLDFKGKVGDPVKSALSGTVKFAGKKGLYGNVLIIKHSNGYESRYAHLSKILVKKGDSIKKGALVAKVGNTGRSTGPHLHFELLKNGKKLNPLTVDLKTKK